MSDYSDLVKRLRRDGIAARDTLQCVEMAPTVDPEDAIDAADAIELLQRELQCANELWEQQKELALEYLADIAKLHKQADMNGRLITENAELRQHIAELEAALKPFEEELKNQELEVPHVIDGDSLIHNYVLRLRDLRSARAALEKNND